MKTRVYQVVFRQQARMRAVALDGSMRWWGGVGELPIGEPVTIRFPTNFRVEIADSAARVWGPAEVISEGWVYVDEGHDGARPAPAPRLDITIVWEDGRPRYVRGLDDRSGLFAPTDQPFRYETAAVRCGLLD